MNEDERLRIQGNFEYLVQNVRAADIQDYLVQEFILNMEENEKLSNIARYETSNAAVRTLLQFLLRSSNPRTYKALCEVLSEKGYDFVVECLDSSDIIGIKAKIVDEKKEQGVKLEMLQKRTWMEYETLVEIKRKQDQIFEKEQQKHKLYDELDTKMKQHGLTADHILNVLLDYMNKGGFITPEQEFEISVTDGIVSANKPLQTASKSVIRHSAQDCKARIIGKDIAFYMVMIKNHIKPIDAPNKYAVAMRNMVDELNERHEGLFMTLVGRLDLEEMSGFQALLNIADVLFSEGANNWGRIVVLYAFAGWMAVNSGFDKKDPQSWEKIATLGDFLGYYVGEKLGDWITEEGGWEAFNIWYLKAKEDKQNLYWPALMLGGVGVGVLLGFTLRS